MPIVVLSGAWSLGWLVRLAHRRGAPFVAQLRDRLAGWARTRSGTAPRIALSLFDRRAPKRPGR